MRGESWAFLVIIILKIHVPPSLSSHIHVGCLISAKRGNKHCTSLKRLLEFIVPKKGLRKFKRVIARAQNGDSLRNTFSFHDI